MQIATNEVHRFSFALVLAFSLFATIALIKTQGETNLWVGIRVLLALGSVVLISYFYLPERVTDPSEHQPSPPPMYAKMFLVAPWFSICTSCFAAFQAKFRFVWVLALILSMAAELFISFKLLIVAREPESFWLIYDILRKYKLMIVSSGIVAALVLSYLSLRERKTMVGSLSSLIFMLIPVGTGIHEWILDLT